MLLVIFVVNSNLRRIFESYLHINLKDFLVTGLELDDRHLATENFLFLKCFPGFDRRNELKWPWATKLFKTPRLDMVL